MGKVYQEISRMVMAIADCDKSGKAESAKNHRIRLDCIMSRYAPSGSGIDNGVKLDSSSTPQKLIFTVDFHHMNENGFYDGWTSHKVTVKPDLAFEIDFSISGRNRNDIKNYLEEVFESFLTEEVDKEVIDCYYLHVTTARGGNGL